MMEVRETVGQNRHVCDDENTEAMECVSGQTEPDMGVLTAAVSDNDDDNATDVPIDRPVAHYCSEAEARNPEFEVRLCQLALKHKWSHNAFRDVLSLLNGQESVPKMPRDPRTLLNTPRRVEVMKLDAEGTQQYYHFGIRNCLQVVLSKWPDELEDGVVLNMQLNMDGLPVANSTKANVHPILARVRAHRFGSAVFCIGVYFGKTAKPDSSHMLMSEFNKEFLAHRETGYDVFGKRVFLEIAAVVCDRVERDLIKDTKNHMAHAGCDKCEVDAEGQDPDVGHVVYTDLDARLRTDESFSSRSQKKHHRSEARSSFELLGVGMVSKFPLNISCIWCSLV